MFFAVTNYAIRILKVEQHKRTPDANRAKTP